MKKSKLGKMTRLAILTAIILLMSFTPLGYIRIGVLEMTLIIVPVSVGAIVMGPGSGLFLGTVFGLTSFYQCFGLSAFGALLLSLNPVGTFFVCVVTRMLMGWLTGVIFGAMSKTHLGNRISSAIASLIGAVLNTVLFMSTLCLFFLHSEAVFGLTDYSLVTVLKTIVAFVGVQGLLEALLCTVISGACCAALLSLEKAHGSHHVSQS